MKQKLSKRQIAAHIVGGILFITGFVLASASFEAYGVTEYDDVVDGYSGYNYENHDHIAVDKDPTGGYDVYNYGTYEHTEIEPDPAGGFTVYGGERGESSN